MSDLAPAGYRGCMWVVRFQALGMNRVLTVPQTGMALNQASGRDEGLLAGTLLK